MVPDHLTSQVSANEAPLAVASRQEAINTHLGVGATDDRAATDLWLAEHSNPQTLRNYRREVDRALVWARLLGKSLAQITLVDWTNFRDALTSRAKYDSLAAAITDADSRAEFARLFAPPVPPKSKVKDSETPAQVNYFPLRAARSLLIIGTLLTWLRNYNYVQAVPLPPPPRSVKRSRDEVMRASVAARMLTPEQFECVRRTLQDMTWADQHDARTLFVLTWLVASGARRQELADADTMQFLRSADGGLFWSFYGKGGAAREVPVTEEMRVAWIRYRLAINRSTELPVPAGHVVEPLVQPLPNAYGVIHGGNVTGATIWRIVKAFGERASLLANDATDQARIKAASPHWYRHMLASKMLEMGIDVSKAAKQLGHASINTTSIYQHIRAEHMADVMGPVSKALFETPTP